MKKSLLIAAILTIALAQSQAKAARDADGPQADCEGLSVATGPVGKGYSKLFADMKKVAGDTVALCEVTTEGGLDNLTTLSTKGADVGIVPIDALKKMAGGDENIQALQIVATLNSNYLHVVTSAVGVTYAGEKKYFGLSQGQSTTIRITRFSDLRGKTVAAVGSAQLLIRQLDKQLDYKMNIIDVSSDAEAFKFVQQGKVLAAFSVAGWPHGALKNLKQDTNLTLVPFDAPINGSYNVKPFSYKGLGVYNVQALSVQNVLVTRPFTGADKIKQVAALKRALADNLDALKDGKFEPGWNEIKSLDGAVDWNKFQMRDTVTIKAKK